MAMNRKNYALTLTLFFLSTTGCSDNQKPITPYAKGTITEQVDKDLNTKTSLP